MTEKISIPDMLKKLNEMYDREEYLIRIIKKAATELKQLQEDKELLQTMIMHQSNKIYRFRE